MAPGATAVDRSAKLFLTYCSSRAGDLQAMVSRAGDLQAMVRWRHAAHCGHTVSQCASPSRSPKRHLFCRACPNASTAHVKALAEWLQMRTPGVEPGPQAWEACMMPLHCVRHEHDGAAHTSSTCDSTMAPCLPGHGLENQHGEGEQERARKADWTLDLARPAPKHARPPTDCGGRQFSPASVV